MPQIIRIILKSVLLVIHVFGKSTSLDLQVHLLSKFGATATKYDAENVENAVQNNDEDNNNDDDDDDDDDKV